MDYLTVQNIEKEILNLLPQKLFFTSLFPYDATPKRQYAQYNLESIQDKIKEQQVKEPVRVGEAAQFHEVSFAGFQMQTKTFLSTGLKFKFTEEFLENSWIAEENINVIAENIQMMTKTFGAVLNREIATQIVREGLEGGNTFSLKVYDEDGDEHELSDWGVDPMIDSDYIDIFSYYLNQADENLIRSIVPNKLYKAAAKYDLSMGTPSSYNNLGSELDQSSTRQYEGVSLINAQFGFSSIAPDILKPAQDPFLGKDINWIGFGGNAPSVKFYVNPKYSAIAQAYYNAKFRGDVTGLDTNVPVPMVNITPVRQDPYDPEVYWFNVFQSAILDVKYPKDIMLGHIPYNENP